ncbi:MAG: hypothetical protein HOP28_10680 [Gemmatimonadales bacterium]|nr:hypothetical protein [Gemmatimonadales bacterium]
MKRATGLLFGLAAVLSGCGVFTEPGEGSRLADARKLWDEQGSQHYTYQVRSDCFCGMAGRWIEVTVHGGAVIAARDLDGTHVILPTELASLPTVLDLFARIQHAVLERAVLLEVQYDPLDGHPTRINVDVSRAVADEEYLLRSRELNHTPSVSLRGNR